MNILYAGYYNFFLDYCIIDSFPPFLAFTFQLACLLLSRIHSLVLLSDTFDNFDMVARNDWPRNLMENFGFYCIAQLIVLITCDESVRPQLYEL